MAVLQGLDGKYYDVPSDQLAKFLIPDDKVKEKLLASGEDLGPPPPPSSEGAGGSPSVVVQIFGSGGQMEAGPGSPPPEEAVGTAGEVMAYSHHWHNHHWHNHCWHNHHWHNHHWHNRHR